MHINTNASFDFVNSVLHVFIFRMCFRLHSLNSLLYTLHTYILHYTAIDRTNWRENMLFHKTMKMIVGFCFC